MPWLRGPLAVELPAALFANGPILPPPPSSTVLSSTEISRIPSSGAVFEPGDAGPLGTSHAAENGTGMLDPVADDLTAAMRTRRRQGVDSTFERVEGVFLPRHGYRECLVVIIAAH